MPSSVYKYDGLAKGLKLMNSKGVAGMKYYLGDGSSKGHEYGLVNVAAFLAQSMKETIKYDACDENSVCNVIGMVWLPGNFHFCDN